jgi:hypothetical protein
MAKQVQPSPKCKVGLLMLSSSVPGCLNVEGQKTHSKLTREIWPGDVEDGVSNGLACLARTHICVFFESCRQRILPGMALVVRDAQDVTLMCVDSPERRGWVGCTNARNRHEKP